jgi:naphthalene 1,2-dioxygenase ferredoxin component
MQIRNKERAAMSTVQWMRVASLSDLGEGEVIGREIDGADIALYKVNGQVYATENVCSHAFARLSDGSMDGYSVECPLHGGKFDVRTGQGLCEPITDDIRTYAVRVIGNDIELELLHFTNVK